MFPPYVVHARRLGPDVKQRRQAPWPERQDVQRRCRVWPEQRARQQPERRPPAQQEQPRSRAGEFAAWPQLEPQPDEERQAQHRSVAETAA